MVMRRFISKSISKTGRRAVAPSGRSLLTRLLALVVLQGISCVVGSAVWQTDVKAQTPLPAAGGLPGGGMVPRRLSLVEAERLLLERNLVVVAAKYQVDANRAARLIASFRPNPTLTVGAEQLNLSGKLFRNAIRTDSTSASASTYTFRYDQLIERGGKREMRTALAEQQLKASEAQVLDVLRQQLWQLRQAFTSAALARENLALARETNRQYDQTISLTAVKVENGEVAGVELYRAQAAALQYQQAVQQALTSYRQAARDILNLLGARMEDVEPGSGRTVVAAPTGAPASGEARIVRISNSPAGPTPTGLPEGSDEVPLDIDFRFIDSPLVQTPEELRAAAISERPDLVAARRLFDAAAGGVSLAKAQRVRDVSVGTFFQRVGSDQTAGVNLSIPLFVHNKGLAAISQAEAQRDAAAALVRQAELQVITDIEKAWFTYQSARRTLDIYNSTTLERAGRLKEIATISYREGATNLIELLDAQRTYNLTINSYNQARADYQMALWQLEQAVGKPLR